MFFLGESYEWVDDVNYDLLTYEIKILDSTTTTSILMATIIDKRGDYVAYHLIWLNKTSAPFPSHHFVVAMSVPIKMRLYIYCKTRDVGGVEDDHNVPARAQGRRIKSPLHRTDTLRPDPDDASECHYATKKYKQTIAQFDMR